jgi:hypothetical protein
MKGCGGSYARPKRCHAGKKRSKYFVKAICNLWASLFAKFRFDNIASLLLELELKIEKIQGNGKTDFSWNRACMNFLSICKTFKCALLHFIVQITLIHNKDV